MNNISIFPENSKGFVSNLLNQLFHSPVWIDSDAQSLEPQAFRSGRHLKDRYATMGQRFAIQRQGRSAKLQFAQAPKPPFTATAYDSPPNHKAFNFRYRVTQSHLIAWPLHRIADLVLAIRDSAVAKLKMGFPGGEKVAEAWQAGRT